MEGIMGRKRKTPIQMCIIIRTINLTMKLQIEDLTLRREKILKIQPDQG
jgi:hypothetical protein